MAMLWMESVTNRSDTTVASYWLNWRFFLCAIWILASMVVGFYVIRKYEGSDDFKPDTDEAQQETVHLRKDDTWRPCIEEIHPVWLLAFRIFAFWLLLVLLILDISIHGVALFCFYTQWTLILLSFYFGFGSVLSILGCCKYNQIHGAFYGHCEGVDAERGSYVPPPHEDNITVPGTGEKLYYREENHSHESSGISNYIFQILFQMSAGAVMLTDCVYWFILFPLLTLNSHTPNALALAIHSLNAFMLLGDTILNSLCFPWFRIGYFILWTGFFVIFQWIIHFFVSIRWPYPFMDLSLPYAPLWYVAVGVMHAPCYGVFALLVRLKYYLLQRCFPDHAR